MFAFETPPRTWRGRHRTRQLAEQIGNTSTHVERTSRFLFRFLFFRETPPRTWRGLGLRLKRRFCSRNTSTHVERTIVRLPRAVISRKHFHARGEDKAGRTDRAGFVETPPRTWRGQSSSAVRSTFTRNTSTHVERTRLRSECQARSRKHLHARGEDAGFIYRSAAGDETPPRTWRGPSPALRKGIHFRNTSTHVERTFFDGK